MHSLSQLWYGIQRSLFPALEEEIGPLTPKLEQLVAIIAMVRVEDLVVRKSSYLAGRPQKDRAAMARAYITKAFMNISETKMLIELLNGSPQVRRICGWEHRGQVPSEPTFCRAFKEFADTGLPARLHETLIEKHQKDRLVGHLSRDSTAIKAREKALEKPRKEPKEKRKRGRPKAEEDRPPKELKRLERQASGEMSVQEMLSGLPGACDFGCKQNSQGKTETWKGYKLHIDWADAMIPVSAILTSASVHDSQVAIPLAHTSAGRVTSLYELMDSAYDAPEIHGVIRSLGHVPIIDRNFRRDVDARAEHSAETTRLTLMGHTLPEARRFNERTNAERGNARIKDEFVGRMVRVRGNAKVYAHLMFSLLVLTADQLLRLAQ